MVINAVSSMADVNSTLDVKVHLGTASSFSHLAGRHVGASTATASFVLTPTANLLVRTR